MANKPFKNVAPAMVLATTPLVAPIQDVHVDDMVKAYHHVEEEYQNPDLAMASIGEEMSLTASNDNIYVLGWQDYDYLDITPETWQVGKFIIEKENGYLIEIEANRPKKWFEDQDLKERGDQAFIYIEEMGIADYAVLQEIRPTEIDTREFELNEEGKVDRPVITTYKRIANEISDYTFSNGQVISCTPNHPFYSSDRQVYIPVGELSFGETVQTSSDREVKFIGGKARKKGDQVYNFEVWREHNYYVGSEEIDEYVLVHNSCKDIVNKVKNMSPSELQQHLDDGWDVVIKSSDDVVPFFATRRYFQDLMQEFRYAKEGLTSTNGLASNFKALDAFNDKGHTVIGNLKEYVTDLAVSMKTTKVAEASNWLNSKNKQHLDDLLDGLTNGITWNGNTVKYSKVRLDIYMPKNIFTPAKAQEWKNYLKSYNGERYKDIEFDISTLEKHIID